MKQKGVTLTAMGLSALIVIFAVVTLALFSALSVSTAMGQKRLGEKTRASTVEYYDADSRAQQLLARLRAGEQPQGITRQGDIYSYRCPMGENRYLAVQVQLIGTNYRVLRWQVCTEAWQAEEHLPVWKGE